MWYINSIVYTSLLLLLLLLLCADELCEGVQVGGEYSVIGVPVYKLRETSQRALVSARLEVRPADVSLCRGGMAGAVLSPLRPTTCSLSTRSR